MSSVVGNVRALSQRRCVRALPGPSPGELPRCGVRVVDALGQSGAPEERIKVVKLKQYRHET